MSITGQDITNQLSDYLGNYTTSTIDPGQKTRAINRAIEYIKRSFGLPCDETIQTFYYNQDNPFIALNSDFDESIFLGYHNTAFNDDTRPWEYRTYPELLQLKGNASFQRFYGFTTINGSKQLYMVGTNRLGSVIVDPMGTVGAWSVGGDGSGLTTDPNNNVKIGSSSLTFKATRSGGTAYLQNLTFSQNISNLIKYGGSVKFYTELAPATNVTNIQLIMSSDTSFTNNYTITATTDDNGVAFAGSTSMKVGFSMTNAVITGTPNPNAIVAFKFVYTLAAGYTTGQIWANGMFFAFPDQMDLVYMTQNKGTDSTGTTTKIILTLPSDIVTIGTEFPDFIDMIAMRAAINCYPSIMGDENFYRGYIAQWNDIMRVWGRVFPRKRTQNSSYQTVIQR